MRKFKHNDTVYFIKILILFLLLVGGFFGLQQNSTKKLQPLKFRNKL